MRNAIRQIIERHLDDYVAQHRLTPHQWKAVGAVRSCRTAQLGGHVRRCRAGHVNGVWYNSCRHRYCHQCHGLASERWLASQRSRLLECSHRHLVFTLPSELRLLFRLNDELLSEALFQSVRETVMTLCRDERHLGAVAGMLLTRHTWGRNLSYHPHIHCLVTEGGLSPEGSWRTPRRRCFLPAKVVMQLYRGKMLAKFRVLNEQGSLRYPRGSSREQVLSLLNRLGRLPWHVRVGERYGHGAGVATYLARYMRGGPCRDSQLRLVGPGEVQLHYRSQRGEGPRRAKLRLSGKEFVARYVSHVPCRRQRLVRSYGLYSGNCKGAAGRAREVLGQSPRREPEPVTWQAYLRRHAPQALSCTVCGEPVRPGEALSRPERMTRERAPPG